MDGNRLAEWKELAESNEDAVDRGDLESQLLLRESQGPDASAAYDSPSLEMWRRGLSASIQPPPSVVESPVRSLVDPSWLREACRGTREDIRRLLRPSRQRSRSGSTPRLSALERPDLTGLGSDDAAASTGRAAPQEAPEEARVRLRTRR